jgi:hypothetical protein
VEDVSGKEKASTLVGLSGAFQQTQRGPAMSKTIMIGCDLHDVSLVLKVADGLGPSTELGDLDRFANRRQLADYLGLAPSAFESGERNDRKGHAHANRRNSLPPTRND